MSDDVNNEELIAPAQKSAAAQADVPPFPSTASSYYTLLMLGGVVMFTVLDRQVLALMIQPVKDDFGISDTQAALLLGAAFSLTYALAGIPIARIADVWNRKKLIVIAIAFWSFMTMMCGIAQNYWQLFMARMGIGIGEAAYAPASWSMLADVFPREKVAFATGVMGIGAKFGQGFALIIGGVAFAVVSKMPEVQLPGIGVLRPWQWAFLIVGFPGILWGILLLFTMKEPARRGIMRDGDKKKAVPFSEVVKYMWDDRGTYGAIFIGSAFKILLSIGTLQWAPTLFQRIHGWEPSKVGLVQGTLLLVISPVALILGGKLSERWTKQGMPDVNLRIVFYVLLIVVPASIAFPLMNDPWVSLTLFGVAYFFGAFGFGPGIAAFQLVTPNQMRAQVSAISLFITNVVGYALGPLVIALITDYVFHDEMDLGKSMSLCAAILGPMAIFVTFSGLKSYARSFKRASEQFV